MKIKLCYSKINGPTENILEIKIDDDASVRELKEKIADIFMLSKKSSKFEHRISFNNIELTDEKRILDYAITNGTVLYLTKISGNKEDNRKTLKDGKIIQKIEDNPASITQYNGDRRNRPLLGILYNVGHTFLPFVYTFTKYYFCLLCQKYTFLF